MTRKRLDSIDINDIIGICAGQYTVLSYMGRIKGAIMYNCRCSCGIEKPVQRKHITHARDFKINAMCVRCFRKNRRNNTFNSTFSRTCNKEENINENSEDKKE